MRAEGGRTEGAPILTPEAVIGLSEMALDAQHLYVSGGVMIDERYWRTVIWLQGEVEKLREVVRLHQPVKVRDKDAERRGEVGLDGLAWRVLDECEGCGESLPCPTLQAIGATHE